jgi:hypothetical protein
MFAAMTESTEEEHTSVTPILWSEGVETIEFMEMTFECIVNCISRYHIHSCATLLILRVM